MSRLGAPENESLQKIPPSNDIRIELHIETYSVLEEENKLWASEIYMRYLIIDTPSATRLLALVGYGT